MGKLNRIEVPVDRILARACERNAPLEIYRTTDKGSRLVGRSRMLGVRDEFLHIDSIQYADDQPRLEGRVKLELFFTVDDARYTAASVFVKSNVRMKLNERKHLYGVRLSRPTAISSGQRRDCYRVDLGVRDAIDVQVHGTDQKHPDCCPRDALRLSGKIFDISQNGIGVHMSDVNAAQLKRGALVYASFALPISDGEQHYLAEVRHVRHVRPTEGEPQYIIGIAFNAWPDVVYMRHLDNALQRFVIEKQRESLRRAG